MAKQELINGHNGHYYIFPQDAIRLKDVKEGVHKTALQNLLKFHKTVYKTNLLVELKHENHYGKKKGILW